MEVPHFWRTNAQRYRLEGEVCPHCQGKIFPPRDICPYCQGEAKQSFDFSGKGEIYSFTVMHEAPAGFEENIPYAVALIKLAEGPLITAQLTDLDPEQPLEIGMPVEMVTRKLRTDGDKNKGLLVYGYKFRPVLK
jgi:uncharacterized protein